MPLELYPRHERIPSGERHALPDARRADPDEVRRQVEKVAASPVVRALLDAVDGVLMILNADRQVVAFSGVRDPRDVAGLRPGELLACTQAQHPGGCGTSAACETCGALGAILRCGAAGRSVEAECLLTSALSGASHEFNVRATPIDVDGERFTVMTLRDVSAEKRREALEQVFLHDVLNTVTGLRGWTQNLRRPTTDVGRAADRIEGLSRQLEREIKDHRALVMAEAGTLVPERAEVTAAEVLAELETVFAEHGAARQRTLEIARPAAIVLETDRALLVRVLVNMVRNALEATPAGGTVRVSCTPSTAAVRFAVHNAGHVPPAVQARIFQRSFSTKAERGRGLGTYGMKLLGERYLGGHVSFVSTEEAGTTFTIRLPVAAVAAAPGRMAG